METEFIRLLTEVEQRSKSNTHQIDELKKRQDNLDNLAAAVSVLGTKYEQMDGDLKEIKADVKSLTATPGKRWEHLVVTALGALVGGIIAYILLKLGLKV